MRFALVTTFFGAHRFGGDAAYAERLAEALLRRGHAVEVFCSHDAFAVTRGRRAPLPYRPPDGLVVHPLRTAFPLWTTLRVHQTGTLGPYREALVPRLVAGGFDVVHLHNVSLLGAAELIALDVPGAVRLMTVHEHWLTCPLSVRWRFDREPCPEPACVRCMLHAGRPPQWWRRGGRLAAAFARLDGAIFPSTAALEAHRDRGVVHRRAAVLPYFVPDAWLGDDPEEGDRDRFLFVGRLVKEKGLEQLIPLFRGRPRARLDVVGDGPRRPALERLAGGAANIRFLGAVAADAVRDHLRRSRALLVPSRFPETLGYVVLEAWSQGVPALVSPAGALPGLVAGGGGHVCDGPAAFAEWIDRWIQRPAEAAETGRLGRERCVLEFGEERHVDRLLGIVAECRGPTAALTTTAGSVPA